MNRKIIRAKTKPADITNWSDIKDHVYGKKAANDVTILKENRRLSGLDYY